MQLSHLAFLATVLSGWFLIPKRPAISMVKIKAEISMNKDPNEMFFDTQSKVDSMLLEQKTEYNSKILRVTEDLYGYTLPT